MLLRYGEGLLKLEEEWKPYDVLEPRERAVGTKCVSDVLADALAKPIDAERFEQVFRGASEVVIIVPDHTRYAAVEKVLPEVLARLERLGVAEEAIEILFALGIHEPQSEEQKRRIIGEEVAARIAYHDHDAYTQGVCEHVGKTSRGTPVEINRRILERVCSGERRKKLLLIGSVSYHYFAGYGGGRKLVVPGCASRRTCFANHLLVFDSQGRLPHARVAELARNPVHLDMIEAVGFVEPDFLVNVILDAEQDIVDIVAGDWRTSHEVACARYKEWFSAPVDGLYDVVIVSAGGHPKDVTFIQAHKAIDMAFEIVKPGGTIVAVAECAEGAGHPDFMRWFRFERPEELERELRAGYQVYGQTALATLTKARAADILLISSLPEETVRAMQLRPAGGLEGALGFVRKKHGRASRACVMPHGAGVLPVKK
jgi:nickel-dependent lactate racemase